MRGDGTVGLNLVCGSFLCPTNGGDVIARYIFIYIVNTALRIFLFDFSLLDSV